MASMDWPRPLYIDPMAYATCQDDGWVGNTKAEGEKVDNLRGAVAYADSQRETERRTRRRINRHNNRALKFMKRFAVD